MSDQPAERPTPETDAMSEGFDYRGLPCLEKSVGLCRRLERERDEARELIAVKNQSINAANQTIMLNNELMRQATDKLAEVREQRDKLADACRWAQSELGKHTRPSPIDSALAAVKGGES